MLFVGCACTRDSPIADAIRSYDIFIDSAPSASSAIQRSRLFFFANSAEAVVAPESAGGSSGLGAGAGGGGGVGACGGVVGSDFTLTPGPVSDRP